MSSDCADRARVIQALSELQVGRGMHAGALESMEMLPEASRETAQAKLIEVQSYAWRHIEQARVLLLLSLGVDPDE